MSLIQKFEINSKKQNEKRLLYYKQMNDFSHGLEYTPCNTLGSLTPQLFFRVYAAAEENVYVSAGEV